MSYLPAECQAAIDQTNAKYNELKEVSGNQISNLRNGDNLNQLQHSMNHIQNITQQHMDYSNNLRNNNRHQQL